jgi:hypothetical protein
MRPIAPSKMLPLFIAFISRPEGIEPLSKPRALAKSLKLLFKFSRYRFSTRLCLARVPTTLLLGAYFDRVELEPARERLATDGTRGKISLLFDAFSSAT